MREGLSGDVRIRKCGTKPISRVSGKGTWGCGEGSEASKGALPCLPLGAAKEQAREMREGYPERYE